MIQPPLVVTAITREFENGSDFWRIIEPFTLARESGHICYAVIRGHQIVHRPDVIIFRGEFFDAAEFPKFLAQCAADKVLVVQDYDDLYMDYKFLQTLEKIRPPGWHASQQDAQMECLRLVPLVTCTTNRIAREIKGRANRSRPTVVVPNAIRLESWQHLTHPDPDWPLVTVMGGDSHKRDWRDIPAIFQGIAAINPDVRFRVVSDDPGWVGMLRETIGKRFEHRNFVPHTVYPWAMERSTVVLAPLEDTVFNACKTPIRHWEATAAGAAFIGSNVLYGQSVVNGETGYLTDDPAEYVRLTCALLDDERRRQQLVSLSRQTVRDHALTKETVDARFQIYYDHWHALYGEKEEPNGASANLGLWTPDQSAGRGAREVARLPRLSHA